MEHFCHFWTTFINVLDQFWTTSGLLLDHPVLPRPALHYPGVPCPVLHHPGTPSCTVIPLRCHRVRAVDRKDALGSRRLGSLGRVVREAWAGLVSLEEGEVLDREEAGPKSGNGRRSDSARSTSLIYRLRLEYRGESPIPDILLFARARLPESPPFPLLLFVHTARLQTARNLTILDPRDRNNSGFDPRDRNNSGSARARTPALRH